jgi:H+-transporting ATPase
LLVRILRLTDPPADVQETIRQQTQEYARRGFRTLGKSSATLSRTLIDAFDLRLKGVACKEGGNGWEFLGLLPMFVSPLLSVVSLSQWPD